jgi:arginine exporter protein ArgO
MTTSGRTLCVPDVRIGAQNAFVLRQGACKMRTYLRSVSRAANRVPAKGANYCQK